MAAMKNFQENGSPGEINVTPSAPKVVLSQKKLRTAANPIVLFPSNQSDNQQRDDQQP